MYQSLCRIFVHFNQYEIREVKISNSNPTVDENGYVSDPGTVTIIHEGGKVQLNGTQKGESGTSPFNYTVQYNKGTIEENSNVRVDTVTNSRPGIVIKKQDWSKNPLQGAAFSLHSGDAIWTFNSAEDGLITEAFLRDGVTYTLTETAAPKDYQGLPAAMDIVANGSNVRISGIDEDYYEIVKDNETTTIIVKNRPYTFKAIKKDKTDNSPLAGVTFALHKEYTVDNVKQISPTPMVGYEELVTIEDGTVPLVNNSLPVGTYELREKETRDGYQQLPEYIDFTISERGFITLGKHPDGVTLNSKVYNNGAVEYTLEVLNTPFKKVSFKKVDIANVDSSALEGAKFDLYAVDENGQQKTPALYTNLTSAQDGMLYDENNNKVFELPVGTYNLVETKAPENYVPKTQPVVVTVTATDVTYDEGTTISSSGRGKTYDETAKTYQLKISNTNGSVLPSTGGIGTHWFYIGGGVLVLGAVILLIARRRVRG